MLSTNPQGTTHWPEDARFIGELIKNYGELIDDNMYIDLDEILWDLKQIAPSLPEQAKAELAGALFTIEMAEAFGSAGIEIKDSLETAVMIWGMHQGQYPILHKRGFIEWPLLGDTKDLTNNYLCHCDAKWFKAESSKYIAERR